MCSSVHQTELKANSPGTDESFTRTDSLHCTVSVHHHTLPVKSPTSCSNGTNTIKHQPDAKKNDCLTETTKMLTKASENSHFLHSHSNVARVILQLCQIVISRLATLSGTNCSVAYLSLSCNSWCPSHSNSPNPRQDRLLVHLFARSVCRLLLHRRCSSNIPSCCLRAPSASQERFFAT